MGSFELFELLKEKLGEETARKLIDYIENIKSQVVTTDVLIKLLDLTKSEIISKTEKDKTEILAKIEELKISTDRKIEELRMSFELKIKELDSKIEQYRLETQRDIEKTKSSLIKWMIGLMIAQTTLIISVIAFLSK
ncbi:hypothetical protein HRbin19_00182 [bacterium HR19]|nr:hypothetical protein HRbin19_00182 [bacterium HR19]